MSERMVVWQDDKFVTRYWVEMEGESEKGKLEEVDELHKFNPYNLMLGSLGACTAIVLHTYAQHHQLKLKEVKIHLGYDRDYLKDCEECETGGKYSEEIHEDILLKGDLSGEARQKLLTIAHACPIYRMFKEGIPIHARLVE